jgi:hypothetical protein
MLEKILYTIQDQSAIFQLAILSSLTFITYSVIYYCLVLNSLEIDILEIVS